MTPVATYHLCLQPLARGNISAFCSITEHTESLAGLLVACCIIANAAARL